jgi:hypothetical protein
MTNPVMGRWVGIGVAVGVGMGVLVGAFMSRTNR